MYLCRRKNSRIDWIGKLINYYEIPRQASLLNGGPRPSGYFGVTFESVDYKEDEHSNHVIRSFITSSVRLSIKKDGSSGKRRAVRFFRAIRGSCGLKVVYL